MSDKLKLSTALPNPMERPRKNPSQYAPEECYDANERWGLNWYGRPIVLPECYEGEHFAAVVPPSGGDPPVCSCGWTRWGDDRLGWSELSDHLRDMCQGDPAEATVMESHASRARS